MNTQGLIEEIKNDFRKYADAGLIDENSLYRDIVLGLKRFGNDLMVLQEKVLEVKGGTAKLPDNFFSLYIAALCEPLGYKVNNAQADNLQASYYYVEKVVKSNRWSECDPCCDTTDENVIRENLYFKDNSVEFYYKNPTLLRLGKSFIKDGIHNSCRNKLVRESLNEITINNFTLNANFSEGDIYIQYYGIPYDEDGFMEIPDTPNGHLESYLEYYLKRRLAERLMANNDAQGLSNLYSVFKQEEQIALRNASNELKMRKITPQTLKRMTRLNKLESLKYEIGRQTWI